MATEVTCPSGMTGVLRGWKVREIKAMVDSPTGKGAVAALNKVLGAIFEPTNPGPYTTDPLDWNGVLSGDRAFILIRSRMLTYEGDYSVRLQCPSRPCRSRFWWDIDLTKLRVQPYRSESLVVFKESNRFEVEQAGRKVTFRLLVGADEAIGTGAHPDMAAILSQRIVSISGVGEDRRRIQRAVEDMDMGEMRSLLRTFDRHDGGIDTEIEAECPECGVVFELDLPFGRDFYLPDFRRSVKRQSDDEETPTEETTR